MATYKSQIRANERYRKSSLKLMQVAYSPHEQDLYAFMQAQDNKAGFIKKLIRAEMERQIAEGTYKPDKPKD